MLILVGITIFFGLHVFQDYSVATMITIFLLGRTISVEVPQLMSNI
jgi:hypothetical protein